MRNYQPHRAVIYTRVSSDKQEEDGTSLDSQVENCQRLANSKQYTVVEVFREAYTGKVYRERKLLTKLRQMVRDGEIDVVIINTLDRLSRIQTHFAILVDEFSHYSVQLECVKEKLDDSPEGQFMRGAYAFMAEKERLKIIDRTQEGRMKRLEGGRLLPGARPRYGYRWADDEKRNLALDTKKSSVVSQIFDMCVTKRLTVDNIARSLSEKGILTATGKQFWDKSTVYRVLTDPIYMGEATALKYESKGSNGAEKHRIKPVEERMAMKDIAVPAIVTRDVWLLAQDILKINKVDSLRNNTNKSANDLLRCGFVKCGYCKRTMSACGTGRDRYYKCGYRYRGGHRCMESPTIGVHKIDEVVWTFVDKIVEDLTLVEKAIELAKQEWAFLPDLKGVEASIKSAQEEQDQIVEDLKQRDERGMLKQKGRARELLLEELSQIENYLEELEIERQKIKQGQVEWVKMLEEIDKFVSWCLNTRETYAKATYEEKRRALCILGIVVYIYREDDMAHERYDIKVWIPDLSDIVL